MSTLVLVLLLTGAGFWVYLLLQVLLMIKGIRRFFEHAKALSALGMQASPGAIDMPTMLRIFASQGKDKNDVS